MKELIGRVALGVVGPVIRTPRSVSRPSNDPSRPRRGYGDPRHRPRVRPRRQALVRRGAGRGSRPGYERDRRDQGWSLANRATTWDADISAPRIRSDVETSLRVFGGERVDLYYLHRVDLAEQPVEEGVGALASLRDEGKVARIGLSNVGVAEPESVHGRSRRRLQNHHSAMGRESLEVLAWCEANEVPFFASSPLRPGRRTPADRHGRCPWRLAATPPATRSCRPRHPCCRSSRAQPDRKRPRSLAAESEPGTKPSRPRTPRTSRWSPQHRLRTGNCIYGPHSASC